MLCGNSEKPYIYMTFDVGYEGGYTEQILDTLKANDVNATFFVTGQFVKTSPDLIKMMIDDGQIVGNHTVNHKSMTNCNEETIKNEIMNLHKTVYEEFNYEMKYLRPPKGEYSESTVAITNSLGYKTVMWSFAYDDWDDNKQGREDYARKKIVENFHNGEIMLLHATSRDDANVLNYIIKEAMNEGYVFKSLDEFEK